MKIRPEQMRTFEEEATRAFETEMVNHLKEFVPRHSEVIGEEGVRQVVRLGMEKAQKCGFTNRGPMRLYIELMAMFGSEFATDPLLPWAAGPLASADEADQMIRAEQLHNGLLGYLERVAGPRNEYTLRALRKLSQTASEHWPPPPPGGIESAIAPALRAVYPEKAGFAGDAALSGLVERGRQEASKIGVRSGEGLAVIVGFLFAVGHGALNDPLFPWVSRTLNDTGLGTPDDRAVKLRERGMAYLKRALPYLEQRNANVPG